MKKYSRVALFIVYIVLMCLILPGKSKASDYILIHSLIMVGLFIVISQIPSYFRFLTYPINSAAIFVAIYNMKTYASVDLLSYNGLLTISLLILLLWNIVLLVKYLYENIQLADTEKEAHKINIQRYLILVFCISLLVMVLLTFSGLYSALNEFNQQAFYVAHGEFDPLYLSFTTYFTVGYGDITPITPISRNFSMIEMVTSYLVTVIYVPIILVLFTKIKDSSSKKKSIDK